MLQFALITTTIFKMKISWRNDSLFTRVVKLSLPPTVQNKNVVSSLAGTVRPLHVRRPDESPGDLSVRPRCRGSWWHHGKVGVGVRFTEPKAGSVLQNSFYNLIVMLIIIIIMQYLIALNKWMLWIRHILKEWHLIVLISVNPYLSLIIALVTEPPYLIFLIFFVCAFNITK